jgi:hypothetical protein
MVGRWCTALHWSTPAGSHPLAISGMTASLTPASVVGPGSAALKITTTSDAPRRTFTPKITGTATAMPTRTVSVTLTAE